MDVLRAGARPLKPDQLCVGTPVVLASDNAGYELKHFVIQYLETCGIEYIDCNPTEGQAKHYPEWSEKAAQCIMDGRAKSGILICGTGIGIGIAAMKCPGVYPVRCDGVMQARMARRELDANVLTFGQRVTGFGVAFDMVYEFLTTPFDEKNAQAVQLMKQAEKRYLKETK